MCRYVWTALSLVATIVVNWYLNFAKFAKVETVTDSDGFVGNVPRCFQIVRNGVLNVDCVK